MKDEFDRFIGYGEGISQVEDIDFFDEHPDFIKSDEYEGV